SEIARIRSLPGDVLRQRWRTAFGRIPPTALSKDLLARMITRQIQEQAFGGLDRDSLRFLDGLARQSGPRKRQLKPGTVLVRDYQGQRHTVTVSREGFDWQGRSTRASRPSRVPSPARPGTGRGSSPLQPPVARA